MLVLGIICSCSLLHEGSHAACAGVQIINSVHAVLPISVHELFTGLTVPLYAHHWYPTRRSIQTAHKSFPAGCCSCQKRSCPWFCSSWIKAASPALQQSAASSVVMSQRTSARLKCSARSTRCMPASRPGWSDERHSTSLTQLQECSVNHRIPSHRVRGKYGTFPTLGLTPQGPPGFSLPSELPQLHQLHLQGLSVQLGPTNSSPG